MVGRGLLAQNGESNERHPRTGGRGLPVQAAPHCYTALMEEPSTTETPEQNLHQPSEHVRSLRASGQREGSVHVQIGPRFLELFSENLYSSPNKAFEELVSNSWDAGASVVHVAIPSSGEDAASGVWVLDNGESMDLKGLEQLWAVASSAKRDREDPPRPQIGKFGIGKLATYILANEVTYICKAADGVIRSVTMDFLDIEERSDANDASQRLHIGPLPLEVRRLSNDESRSLIATFPEGTRLIDLIDQGIPSPKGETEVDDGFGGESTEIIPQTTSTWTLALLTNLKDQGRRIQAYQIRRMLRAALPLGASIAIGVNGDAVESTKLDVPVHEQWTLGPGLGLDPLEWEEDSDPVPVEEIGAPPYPHIEEDSDSVPVEKIDAPPYPHVKIEGIDGPITGTVRLYEQRISGGKSEDRSRSVGFFINVRGRVIALDDPYFGLENLSHGAWAHFRCVVRADGLDAILNVERDTLRDGPQLRLFRALLRALFNKARSSYIGMASAVWPNAGQLLQERWGAFPLQDLGQMVSERIGTAIPLPSFIDDSDIGDTDALRTEWQRIASEKPADLIADILDGDADPGQAMATYRLDTRQLVVNSNHPFVREHGATAEEKELVRDLALLDFLVETRMITQGIDPGAVEEIYQYRDQVMRVLARLRRRTGAQIAQLLEESTGHSRGLEVIMGEALEYLGFVVTPIAGKGEPEGVAKAALTPRADDQPESYSFTYEAKSTNQKSGKVQSHEVNPGKLRRHRRKHQCDYTLVIAPDFAEGVIVEECTLYQVTPMRATDLATLLIRSGKRGMIPLLTLKTLFQFYDPDSVHEWVQTLAVDDAPEHTLTLDLLLEGIEAVGFEGPDVINSSTVAQELRRTLGKKDRPTNTEVKAVAQGLGVLLPGLIEVNGQGDLYLAGSVSVIRQRIREMLDRFPTSLQAQYTA